MGQHDTPEQQYRQVLLEIQSLIYTIRVVKIEVMKNKIIIDRLRATGDELDELEAQIKEVGLEQASLTLLGANRELKDLLEIWESFPHKFTYEEIESNQAVYWDARLMRQAQLEAIGGNGKVAWASLDALRQIGKIDTDSFISSVEMAEIE